jgi:Cu-processing system permease protein
MNSILAVAGIVIKELYRRKDVYVLFVLTVLLCLIMGSVRFFNDGRIVRYLKEICLLLVWISSLIIAITCAARQIPAERENRTLLPLLAKPLTRWQLLLGKFFGCWFACGLALLCFYLFFGLLAATREHYWPVLEYAQAAFLHWVMLGVVVALALFGSLVFAAPSSNATICFAIVSGILLLGRHLDKVALQLPEPRRSLLYGLYYVIPHLELFDVRDLIIHDWPPIAWGVCALATLYATAYAAVFLTASCLVFRRKAVN